MRLPALAALAALAACSVKLEGAPCATDANCPTEQRCDLEGAAMGRCVTCVPDPACSADGTFCAGGSALRECRSTTAGCRYSDVNPCALPLVCVGGPGATCQCPAAAAAPGSGCPAAGNRTCDPASRNILACAQQGTCLVWDVQAPTCSSQQLACREPTPGQPVCACDLNPGPTLFVDAVSGSAAGASPYPTGLDSPPKCRFKKLGDALTAASAGTIVKMTGWTAGEVKFSAAATGETFPLQVKPGVTLTTGDAPPAPAHYVVEVDQAGTSRPVLQLDHDAAASGFTVRPGASGSASTAVLVNCAQPGTQPVAVSSLVLDGRGALAASAVGDGLRLMGTCGVGAGSLLVQNASGAGIRVGTSFPPLGSAPVVSIASSTIRGNGDGGLVVSVDASNGRPSLSVTNNDITQNAATTPYTDTSVVPNVIRRGGGVVLLQAAPSPLVFTGNRVHGNLYDQVLVWSSDAWTLSGSACDATSNVFTCYDLATSGGPWVGLSLLGNGTVGAVDDSWSFSIPQPGRDFYKSSLGTVNASPACAASSLTCP